MNSIHLCGSCVRNQNIKGCLLCKCPKLSTGADCYWCNELGITEQDRQEWKTNQTNQMVKVNR